MKYRKNSLVKYEVLNDPERVCKAIAAGAEVGARDGHGRTPLGLACALRGDEIIAILLQAGAEVNVRDDWGRTPLHRCRRLQHAQLLIAAGANVNVRNNRGETPLHAASTPEIAVALLEAGADWRIRDDEGRTPIQHLQGADQSALAEAIERWVEAHEHSQALSSRLKESGEQQGPGL